MHNSIEYHGVTDSLTVAHKYSEIDFLKCFFAAQLSTSISKTEPNTLYYESLTGWRNVLFLVEGILVWSTNIAHNVHLGDNVLFPWLWPWLDHTHISSSVILLFCLYSQFASLLLYLNSIHILIGQPGDKFVT